MVALKRILSTFLVAAMVISAVPATVAAQYMGVSVINIDQASSNGTIAYRVLGPDAAVNVTISIYRVSAGSTCLTTTDRLVTFDEGTKPVSAQPYTRTWNGKDRFNAAVGNGAYCFNLNWSNPQIGVNSILTGALYVTNGRVTGPNVDSGNNSGGGYVVPANNNNPPAGGSSAGAGNSPAGGSCLGNPQPDVCHSVSPSVVVVNPTLRLGQHLVSDGAVVHYNVNRRIVGGLTIVIRDLNRTTVRTLRASGATVEVGSYPTVPWDGISEQTGKLVPEGSYRYSFLFNGREISNGSGNITVRYQTPAQPQQPPANNGNNNGGANGRVVPPANPMTARNLRATPNPFNSEIENTRLYFDLNKTANVIVAVYRQDGTYIRNIFPISGGSNVQYAGQNSVTWAGVDQLGYKLAAGTYRLRVTANGLNNGADRDIAETTVTVTRSAPQPVPQPQTAGITVRNLRATPNPFNPDNEANTRLYFDLSKNANVSVGIYGQDGSYIRNVFPVPGQSGVKNAGTDYVTWAGVDRLGYKIAAGTYKYRVTANALNNAADRDIAEGSVTITRAAVVPPQPVGPFIVGQPNVNPSTFRPANGERTTITYTLGKAVTGFKLSVRDRFGNTIETLRGPVGTLSAGTYSDVWDGLKRTYLNNGGRIALGSYDEGVYTFVLSANGETSVLRNVTIELPAQNPPVITDAGPTSNPFNPASGTTIRFLVNQDSRADVTIYRGNTTIRRIKVANNASNNAFAAITNTAFWDGRDDATGAPVAADGATYTYTIQARNENGIAQMRTGSVRVTIATPEPPVQNAPVINDLGATPNPMDISIGTGLTDGTTIRYTVNQDSQVDVTVYRNGTVVRKLKIGADTSANVTNFAFWDGKDDATGRVVPIDGATYTYTIQARNQNGIAQMKTGTVTVSRTFIPPQQPLVINDLGATPNPFYPSNGTTIRYSVNQSSQVTVTVYRGGTVVRTLKQSVNTDANVTATAFWDGRDTATGYYVSEDGGTYTYTIQAVGNQSGMTQTVTGTVRTTINNNPPDPVLLSLTNLYATPDPFDPVTQNNTSLWFTLNSEASVTVGVYNSNGTFVRSVGSPSQSYSAGSNSVSWNGTDQNNSAVTSGSYYFKVEASSAARGNDTETRSFTVSRSYNPPVYGNLQISNVYATPSTFSPENESTYFNFSLNYDSYVTVTVTRDSDNSYIRTPVSGERFYVGTNNRVNWTGVDQYGYRVSDGSYKFKIEATTVNPISGYRDYSRDSASYTGTVTVSRGYNPPSQYIRITDNGASPSPFNPRLGDVSKILFSTNIAPSSLSVRVYDYNNSFVRELPVYTTGSYGYRAEWNGRDYNNNYVNDGAYSYKINVSASDGQSAQSIGTVSVGNSYVIPYPPVPPYPPYYGDCGGFTDVNNANAKLCEAIKFVKDHGIFAGYGDGTIGVDRVIQRAEMLAVMQKAFKIPLEYYDPYLDGNLGYADLSNKTGAWYMPYIKTFSKRGLMVGYPDGQMKPGRTMNTAELFLTFFKSAKKSPYSITNYTVTNHVTYAPYKDTPISEEAGWYMKYAFFAKLNDLVRGDYFRPGKGITRGQVIQLVYDTYRKGLISYDMPMVAQTTY